MVAHAPPMVHLDNPSPLLRGYLYLSLQGFDQPTLFGNSYGLASDMLAVVGI